MLLIVGRLGGRTHVTAISLLTIVAHRVFQMLSYCNIAGFSLWHHTAILGPFYGIGTDRSGPALGGGDQRGGCRAGVRGARPNDLGVAAGAAVLPCQLNTKTSLY